MDSSLYSSQTLDKRWCRGSENRIGEFGVIDAEQHDESHFDDRSTDDDDDDGEYPDEDEDDDELQSGGMNARGSSIYNNNQRSSSRLSGGAAAGRIKFSKRRTYGREQELEVMLTMCWARFQMYAQAAQIQNEERQGQLEVLPAASPPSAAATASSSSSSDERKESMGELNEAELCSSGSSHDDVNMRTPWTAFITGFSGCGKSTLVNEFVKRLRGELSTHEGDRRLLFLSAKYSQQPRAGKGRASIITTPFGALGSLFDLTDDEETRQEIGQHLSDTLKGDMDPYERKILHRIFPGLTDFMKTAGCASSLCGSLHGSSGSLLSAAAMSDHDSERDIMSVPSDFSESTTHRSGKDKIKKEQLEFVLQRFFELLSSNPNRPLVLFLDDLQWSDCQSLEFLRKLLINPKPSFFFFVGAYRSNEVTAEHPLIKVIDDVENEKKARLEETSILRLSLKELSMNDVGQFIADTLRLDTDQVEPLTRAIYTKTFGNPFCTRQALEQLVRKNVLYYDTITFEWNWNLSSQKELENLISDDMEEMVKNKLDHLSSELQQVLVVASCITHSGAFDVATLLEILRAAQLPTPPEAFNGRSRLGKAQLIDLLNEGVVEGLLMQSMKAHDDIYSFSHDRIEDAAHRFMGDVCHKDEIEYHALLFEIGTTLHQRAQSAYGEDWMYFTAAHQLNSIRSRGTPAGTSSLRSSLLMPFSRDQEVKLAELNHQTASLSLDLLAFKSAAEFCRFGVQDLVADENDDKEAWDGHYDLILSLYTLGAEAEYSAGNIDEALSYCERIVTRQPRSIYDFLPAYKVKLAILGGQKKGSDRIFDLSFSLCEKLGFKFPKGARLQKIAAWTYLRNTRARYIPTEKSINNMSFVTDQTQIDTFNVLMTAGSIAYQVQNMELYVLVACEGLKWMSQNGLTDESATAISSFANSLMHVYGDFDTSTQLADLSIVLTNRIKKKFSSSRPLNTAGMFVLGWVRPLRTLLHYHTRAEELALTSGNIEGVGVSKTFMSWNMMYSSIPLSKLESFCRKGLPQLHSMNLTFDASLVTMTWQTVLNLVGRSDNTIVMTGKAMDENTAPYCNMPFSRVLCVWKRFLCVFFGEWEIGAKSALEDGDAFESGARGMMFGMETFIRGMLLFGMARKCSEMTYKKAALQALHILKEWVKKGCINLIGPTKILKAELCAMNCNKKKTLATFDQAISACQAAEFHHYEGLGRERLAAYLHEIGQMVAARKQLSQAIECYSRWGATCKVDELTTDLCKTSGNMEPSRLNEAEESAPE